MLILTNIGNFSMTELTIYSPFYFGNSIQKAPKIHEYRQEGLMAD